MHHILYELNNNTHIESHPKRESSVSSNLGGQIRLFAEE